MWRLLLQNKSQLLFLNIWSTIAFALSCNNGKLQLVVELQVSWCNWWSFACEAFLANFLVTPYWVPQSLERKLFVGLHHYHRRSVSLAGCSVLSSANYVDRFDFLIFFFSSFLNFLVGNQGIFILLSYPPFLNGEVSILLIIYQFNYPHLPKVCF